MIVSFQPMVNTGASNDAAYMNFLRCVKAIATAAAGTSSLTVNPFTNNTGTIDSTRNCITSIISNTEAGGWTESSRSNVVQSGSFTATSAITASYTYLFDAWSASGKGVYPYLKFTLSTPSATTSCQNVPIRFNWTVSYTAAVMAASVIPVMCTFGYSSSTDWTDTKYPPGNGTFNAIPNSNFATGPTAKTSISFNINDQYGSDGANSYNPTSPNAFVPHDPNRIFFMACTANYIIIWEQHINNSYLAGYANQLTNYQYTGTNNPLSYGTLWASGFREAQAWENSYSNNPPIYSMWITHQRSYGTSNSANSQAPGNMTWAPMLTINDSGVISTTLGHAYAANFWNEQIGNPTVSNPVTLTYGALNANSSLDQPVMLREIQGGVKTNQLYKPGVDNTTGVAVPAAYPVMIRRSASGSWNNGGAIRGIYKSLSMPIATMRNYFANGQTFTIYNSVTGLTDTYLPIVFNEDMWLVRYA